MTDAELEKALATFDAAIRQRPDYPLNLLGLAELAATKKHPLRALEIARRAMALAPADPQVAMRGRRLAASLLPGYHVPMMNDERRNAAWDAALRRAIRPGMHVLEIGTGGGMLAMMAARPGAERVITCEKHPVAAAMARELVERNGLAGQIEVIARSSADLQLGRDLERPADLLFCDIFGDNLLDFDPLPALANARRRLLVPGAPVLPAGGSVRAAVGHWAPYARRARMESAAGFDVTPFAAFVAAGLTVRIGDPDLDLLSGAHDLFRFAFASDGIPNAARTEAVCECQTPGTVNGIVRWIRLELDGETALEARPEPGAVFFSAPIFSPLAAPLAVRAGDRLRIGATYRGTVVECWLAGRG